MSEEPNKMFADNCATSNDMSDPDAYLERLIAALPENSEMRGKLETIRHLSSEDKTAWLSICQFVCQKRCE